MDLFGRKRNTEEKAAPKKVVKKAKADKSAKAVKPARTGAYSGYASILSRPRITEKASVVSEVSNAYTFEIPKTASKHDVARAIQEFYKVIPRKVTTTTLPGKRKLVRGRMADLSGVKKATVFLREGDKLEVI